MPSWLDSHFALGFFVGCMVAVIVYAIDWYWHVKVRPHSDERKRLFEGEKPDNTLTGQLYKTDRERHPEEYGDAPPSSSLTDSPEPPVEPGTATIEEQPGPRTSDLPETQEHPAPKTALIDITKPPPPLPYTGPERRLRSDNPYPELRRRAEDRERYEDLVSQRPTPPPQDEQPRMTRAEERRLREQQEKSDSE